MIIRNQEGLQFLSGLPDESVDLVLTDPPYITSRDSGMDKWVDHVAAQDAAGTNLKSSQEWEMFNAKMDWDKFFGDKKKNIETLKKNYLKYGSIYGKKYAVRTDYGAWDSEFTMEDLQLFINHFYRVLKPGGTCIVFFDLWKITPLKEQLESAMFKQIRFIEWLKTNPQPINSKVNYLTNCREIALLGIKKSKPTFNSSYDKAVYEYPIQGGKDRFHPTQKNTKMFEELIEKHSNEGDVVLDCFLGSGTTAVAAKNTNRDFIGCELEKEYFDKLMLRINHD
jgi:site-specific DNA-methyltransferase (adenine-specific)|tara:strand:- start:11143 stop:11985 length:843 start_codon:yes stop_codon:yes gene_type:complete